MPRPTRVPDAFATDAGTRVAPTAGRLARGYEPGLPVPPLTHNDQWGLNTDWIRYLALDIPYNAHLYLFLTTADQITTTGSPAPTSAVNPLSDRVDISFGGNGTLTYRFTRVVLAGETAKIRLRWGAKTGSEDIRVDWSLFRPTSAASPFVSAGSGAIGAITISAGSGEGSIDIPDSLSPGIYAVDILFTVSGSTGTNGLDGIQCAITYGTP